jgi:hypothetical protein
MKYRCQHRHGRAVGFRKYKGLSIHPLHPVFAINNVRRQQTPSLSFFLQPTFFKTVLTFDFG